MRNNFFDNIYDFIAKKWRHLFAIIGFSAAGAAILLDFIGGLTATDGKEFLYYFISLLFQGALLAGIIFGYFRGNKRLLFGSFIGFFTLLFSYTCVSAFFGLSTLKDAGGAYVAYWIFQLFYGIIVGVYLVFMVLVNLFNFKDLEKPFHYIYLGIFPMGVLAWILGIVGAANSGAVNWTEAIVPLLEAAAFLFFPAVLALSAQPQEKKEEPAPVKEEPKEEQPEEPKEEKKPANKKAAPKKEEAVDPEVQEEPKE